MWAILGIWSWNKFWNFVRLAHGFLTRVLGRWVCDELYGMQFVFPKMLIQSAATGYCTFERESLAAGQHCSWLFRRFPARMISESNWSNLYQTQAARNQARDKPDQHAARNSRGTVTELHSHPASVIRWLRKCDSNVLIGSPTLHYRKGVPEEQTRQPSASRRPVNANWVDIT